MLDSPDADKDEGHVSENQKPDALVSLVAEINSAHDAVCAALSAGLVHARRAGELLLRAKATLEHGDWLPWLTEHWPGDSRADRARLYMRVAREWSALEAKAQRVADLPLRQALALLADSCDSTSRDARPTQRAGTRGRSTTMNRRPSSRRSEARRTTRVKRGVTALS